LAEAGTGAPGGGVPAAPGSALGLWLRVPEVVPAGLGFAAADGVGEVTGRGVTAVAGAGDPGAVGFVEVCAKAGCAAQTSAASATPASARERGE
jgi:hypothetical protein